MPTFPRFVWNWSASKCASWPRAYTHRLIWFLAAPVDWTMIGCERSLQFHRHFYGDEPPRVEMCPRLIAGERKEPTLLKCCLLETHIEQDKNIMVVPWGADLAMVEAALRKLSEEVVYA